MVFYQICSNGGAGVQNDPAQSALGSNHRNRWKIFKNLLLQNHLPQMLEIRYLAFSSDPLPSLFKPRSEGPKLPYARGSWVWSIEIHRQYGKKNFCYRTTWLRCLKFGIKDCIVELFWVCLNGDFRYQNALLHWVLGLNSLTQVSDLGPS